MDIRPLPDATYWGGWPPDNRSPVGRAAIIGTRLILVQATTSDLRRSNRNLAAHGEILAVSEKEDVSKRVVHDNHIIPGPIRKVTQAFTLPSRVRAILHTHNRTTQERRELEEFLVLSREANTAMRHWGDLSRADKAGLSIRLVDKTDRLLGRINSHLTEVATRTAQRATFQDRRTGRINPGASATEFLRTAELEGQRLEITQYTLWAARNHANEWVWLMGQVMADVEEILAICANPLTDVSRQHLGQLLQHLPKPFCYAAAYSWNTRTREIPSPVLVMQLHERIQAAFVAELLLLGFDLLLSEVNHNLGLLEQLSVDDLTSGLPGAGFDLPYQELSRRLREKCYWAVTRYQSGNEDAANRLIVADEEDAFAAMGAKDILRYRVVDPRFGHQMPGAYTWLEPKFHELLQVPPPQAVQPRPRPAGRRKPRRQKALF